jgi:hypothetical protein
MPAMHAPAAISEAIFASVLTIQVLLLRFKKFRLAGQEKVFEVQQGSRVSFPALHLYIQVNPEFRSMASGALPLRSARKRFHAPKVV